MKYKDRGDIKYVDFEKYNDMMLGQCFESARRCRFE